MRARVAQPGRAVARVAPLALVQVGQWWLVLAPVLPREGPVSEPEPQPERPLQRAAAPPILSFSRAEPRGPCGSPRSPPVEVRRVWEPAPAERRAMGLALGWPEAPALVLAASWPVSGRQEGQAVELKRCSPPAAQVWARGRIARRAAEVAPVRVSWTLVSRSEAQRQTAGDWLPAAAPALLAF